jgi:hypothetical protein
MRGSSRPRAQPLTTRLVHAARALEAGGIYNAAKVLRALAVSQEIRASILAGEPVASEERDREIQGLISALRAEGIDEAILRIVDHGRIAALENRTIRIDEIPPVFVCRTCGQVALRQPPPRCDVCGARPLSWREILPIYFLEPLQPPAALEALAATGEDVEASVRGLTEEEMAQAPSPGEWAVRDVLSHLLTAQGLLAGRVEKILAEDMPSLEGVAAWALGSQEGLPAGDMLARYRESRRATVDRLASISLQDWWRAARHSEWGEVTLLQQASYFARHDASHVPQIDVLRAAMGA